ncbi:MAG: hypothetical protein AAF430_07885 [Myxococcota bacterium]
MRRLLLGLVLGALLLGGTGCFRVGVTAGFEIPQSRVDQIVPGETTKADILQWFGAPADATDGEIFARLFDAGEVSADDLVALPFSDLLVYEITDGEARILMTILYNWSRVDIHRDRLMIFFDENDVVLYYGITRQRPQDREPVEQEVSGGGSTRAAQPEAAPAEPEPDA